MTRRMTTTFSPLLFFFFLSALSVGVISLSLRKAPPGHAEGFKAGHAEGYKAGHAEGYADGHAEAHKVASSAEARSRDPSRIVSKEVGLVPPAPKSTDPKGVPEVSGAGGFPAMRELVLRPTEGPPCKEQQGTRTGIHPSDDAEIDMDPVVKWSAVYDDPATQALAKDVTDATVKAMVESGLPLLRTKIREAAGQAIQAYMPTTTLPPTTTTLTTTGMAEALEHEVDTLKAEQKAEEKKAEEKLEKQEEKAEEAEEEAAEAQAEVKDLKAKLEQAGEMGAEEKAELERLKLMTGSAMTPPPYRSASS